MSVFYSNIIGRIMFLKYWAKRVFTAQTLQDWVHTHEEPHTSNTARKN